MHAPLLPFYAGAAKGCGGAGGQPTAHCCKPEAVQGAGRPQAARRPPPQAPPGLRPECLPLAETSRGGAYPLQKPAKKEEPFGSPVNVIRF